MSPRHVPDVDREVPVERGPAVASSALGVNDGFRQAFSTVLPVGTHVRIAEGPQPQGPAVTHRVRPADPTAV